MPFYIQLKEEKIFHHEHFEMGFEIFLHKKKSEFHREWNFWTPFWCTPLNSAWKFQKSYFQVIDWKKSAIALSFIALVEYKIIKCFLNRYFDIVIMLNVYGI